MNRHDFRRRVERLLRLAPSDDAPRELSVEYRQRFVTKEEALAIGRERQPVLGPESLELLVIEEIIVVPDVPGGAPS